jgi:hypothetical protein
MANVKVTLNVEVDGEPVQGFPMVRRFEPVDKASFDATLANNAAFVAIPAAGEIAATQFLLFRPVGALMSIKLAGDGTGVALNKGGFVLVVDSSGFTGTTVQNTSGAGAKAQGILAGT